MAIATGMSVEQMQNMLNSMGVKAELTTTTKKTKVKVPWYRTKETVHEDGSRESHVVE
jgi:ribosomal protein L21